MIILISVERVTSSKTNKIKKEQTFILFWTKWLRNQSLFNEGEKDRQKKSDGFQLTCSNSVKITEISNDKQFIFKCICVHKLGFFLQLHMILFVYF